jgi:hypothetical protein
MITNFELMTPSSTSILSFNILLHIVILFTILSIFFTKYITNVSSNIINDEITHIVHNGIKKSSNSIKNAKNKLYQNIIDQNKLIEQFTETENNEEKLKIKDKINQMNDIIDKLKDKIQNNNIEFKYDYYFDLFSKEDYTRSKINNEVFFYIKFTNILLIVFLILFVFYLLKTKTVNITQINEVFLENLLTFMMVGIIEFLFFNNVAMKYIPSEPSLIFTSFIDGFNKEN